MVSSSWQTKLADDGAHCGRCQHRVDVRGMEQIVCLAHLAVFQRAGKFDCDEFESQRTSLPSTSGVAD